MSVSRLGCKKHLTKIIFAASVQQISCCFFERYPPYSQTNSIWVVAVIVAIAVKIVTFYCGDILFYPFFSPAMGAVVKAGALNVYPLLGKYKATGGWSGCCTCTVFPLGKEVLHLRQCTGVVILPHGISIANILHQLVIDNPIGDQQEAHCELCLPGIACHHRDLHFSQGLQICSRGCLNY